MSWVHCGVDGCEALVVVEAGAEVLGDGAGGVADGTGALADAVGSDPTDDWLGLVEVA
jgi:hypothetical protein